MTTESPLGIKAPIDPKNPNYYLDKDQMRNALREYRDDCIAAELNGTDAPIIPKYIGECFLNISKGLAMKHNFRKYSFNQDMVMDGVMTCVKNIRSFNPDMISTKTGQPVSPLAYFTQTCFFAFLNRIKLEEDQSAVKWALLLKEDIESYVSQAEGEDFKLNLEDFIKCLGPQKFLDQKPKKEKKAVIPKTPLDDL